MTAAAMKQRILGLYNDSGILNPLRQSLTRYVTSGITLGGQVGLTDLGLSGTFTLTNVGIRANVDRYVNSMVATDGDRSVTRTTANEMAAFIARQMEEIEAQEEEEEDLNLGILLGLPLAAFITGRAGTRALTISAHEGVAATRYGMVAAYVGNGLPFLVYVLNRRLDPAQGCGCDQHDGKVYSSSAIPPDARIPRHIGCNCSYTPYFPGWTKPETIWTGQ